MENNTFLGNPYFFYEFVPINMTLNNNNVNITSAQFMEYFVHGTKKIRHMLDTTGKLTPEANIIYYNLQRNWPEMKRINHLNLKTYEKVGGEELDIVASYSYSLSGISRVLITIIIIIIYYFYHTRQKLEK